MKKLLLIILAAALFTVSACTCGTRLSEATAAPEAPTAVPTAAPTPERTAALTEAPTEEPAVVTPDCAEPAAAPTEAPSARPAYPTPGPVGVLTDGPIFSEPAKYLVIDGESDLHYVYDANGELVCCFNAEYSDDPDYSSEAGLYTEFGRPYDFDLSVMQPGVHYHMLGDIAFLLDWDATDYWSGVYVSEIRSKDLSECHTIEKWKLNIGNIGAILHADGKYITVNADWEDFDQETATFDLKYPLKVYNESFEQVGELDPAKFSKIAGVYGSKYIITAVPGEGEDMAEKLWNCTYNIMTLDGECVMENVRPVFTDRFMLEEEAWFAEFCSADYLTDAEGRCFDPELNEIPSLPEDAAVGYMHARYGVLTGLETEFVVNGVYAGTRDKEGNWLFRIYNPRNASDGRPYGW
ncbi:MAG: hypothetical protein J5544_04460 [Clostridia bacterium]|nr:hypothetical protein [Clostridia bacterium]